MTPGEYVETFRAISDNDVYRVRSVPASIGRCCLQGAGSRLDNGQFQSVILLGLDDATWSALRNFTLGFDQGLEGPDPRWPSTSRNHFSGRASPSSQGR